MDDIDAAENESKDFWIQRSSSVTFAEIHGKVVGTVGFYREEKTKMKHIMNVVGVYVLPEYRSMKIGYKLLITVLDHIKKIDGIKVINLCVANSQMKAMGLYESLGFVEVGKLKYAVKVEDTYYDEYLMQMYL